MSQYLFDILQSIGIFLTLIALVFAGRQAIAQRQALKATSKIILRSTRLLYVTVRVFSANRHVLREDERLNILRMWQDFLEVAESMYQDDLGWQELMQELKEMETDAKEQ